MPNTVHQDKNLRAICRHWQERKLGTAVWPARLDRAEANFARRGRGSLQTVAQCRGRRTLSAPFRTSGLGSLPFGKIFATPGQTETSSCILHIAPRHPASKFFELWANWNFDVIWNFHYFSEASIEPTPVNFLCLHE